MIAAQGRRPGTPLPPPPPRRSVSTQYIPNQLVGAIFNLRDMYQPNLYLPLKIIQSNSKYFPSQQWARKLCKNYPTLRVPQVSFSPNVFATVKGNSETLPCTYGDRKRCTWRYCIYGTSIFQVHWYSEVPGLRASIIRENGRKRGQIGSSRFVTPLPKSTRHHIHDTRSNI